MNDLRLLDPGYKLLKPSHWDRVVGINRNDECSLSPRAEGDVTINLKTYNGHVTTLYLPKVVFLPEMDYNIISVRDLAQENGASVHFFESHAEIHLKGRVIRTPRTSSGLYEITSKTRRSRKQRR